MKNKFAKVMAGVLCLTCIFSVGTTAVSAAVVEDAFVADNNTQSDSEADDTLPSSYSSRELGFVTNVKNQLYSDCWAYGGLATFESKLLHDGFAVTDMSVDHLNAWATTRSNGKGWQRTYTSDGYAEITLGYLTSWQGGVTEADAGRIELNNEIMGDTVNASLAKYGTTGVKYLDGVDRAEVKQAIIDNGGVYTAYASTSACTSKDRTSYYMPSAYAGSYVGHAIELVGWDDNYDVSNFDSKIGKPKQAGAWLVKNSWGMYNSLDGYFWISYEDKYVLGDKYSPSYTVTEVEEINEDKHLVQNEIYGATYEFGYVESKEITFINRFDFTEEYNNLDKVVFETESKGADYSIYYVPDTDLAPTADKAMWVKLYDGVVNCRGYICADIEDYRLPAGKGSIAVTIDTTALSQDEYSTLGVGEWITTTNGDYRFLNETQYGESYIYYDNKLSDVLDWYRENNGDEFGGTFVIKAITTKTYELGDVTRDRIVNIMDATLIQKYVADLATLNDVQRKNADFDGNGYINVLDATAIQKFVAGI